MDEHYPSDLMPAFEIRVPYPSGRESLVGSVINLLREERVVVIRAPPFSGKSTLLNLIGAKILREYDQLEPVLFHWPPRSKDEIGNRSYKEILTQELKRARKENEEWRSRRQPYYLRLVRGFGNAIAWVTGLVTETIDTTRDRACPVYLIDNAVNTYHERAMWEERFKNPDDAGNALFVLVCVHGSADGMVQWGSDLSEASQIESHRRIELRGESLCMLLSSLEIREIVGLWAKQHPFQIGSNLIEYLIFETQGHAGMLQMVLKHLSKMFSSERFDRDHRISLTLDGASCHRFLFYEDPFLDQLKSIRGFWTPIVESRVRERLKMEKEEKSQYQYLTFEDIENSVKRAASQLGGYQTDERDLAFELCHKLGVLYVERNDEDSLTRYIFASRLHQRYDPLSF
ncbi:MAG: hypothetical protein Q9175_007890 [Cornicularia normoerica]